MACGLLSSDECVVKEITCETGIAQVLKSSLASRHRVSCKSRSTASLCKEYRCSFAYYFERTSTRKQIESLEKSARGILILGLLCGPVINCLPYNEYGV